MENVENELKELIAYNDNFAKSKNLTISRGSIDDEEDTEYLTFYEIELSRLTTKDEKRLAFINCFHEGNDPNRNLSFGHTRVFRIVHDDEIETEQKLRDYIKFFLAVEKYSYPE